MAGRFLSIGECMVELSQAGNGLLRKGFAGDTFNTAWYAKACFEKDWTVDYFTTVGDDALSAEMVGFMEAAGIGTSQIRTIAGATPGLYLIDLKDGERTFSYWRGSSAARHLAEDVRRLRQAIATSDVVYFSGVTLAILPPEGVETLLSEVRIAKADGNQIVFDPNLRPGLWTSPKQMRDTICKAAGLATLVMPSFEDEGTYFGDNSTSDTIRRYRELGASAVVVKNGPHGVTTGGENQDHWIPAENVDFVVDTTSAGDSFNAAFLSVYLDGHDPIASAKYAARVAAKVIAKHGALVELLE